MRQRLRCPPSLSLRGSVSRWEEPPCAAAGRSRGRPMGKFHAGGRVARVGVGNARSIDFTYTRSHLHPRACFLTRPLTCTHSPHPLHVPHNPCTQTPHTHPHPHNPQVLSCTHAHRARRHACSHPHASAHALHPAVRRHRVGPASLPSRARACSSHVPAWPCPHSPAPGLCPPMLRQLSPGHSDRLDAWALSASYPGPWPSFSPCPWRGMAPPGPSRSRGRGPSL